MKLFDICMMLLQLDTKVQASTLSLTIPTLTRLVMTDYLSDGRLHPSPEAQS